MVIMEIILICWFFIGALFQKNHNIFRKMYGIIGSPVVGTYGLWYKYLWPKRLTLHKNPAIYKWLRWNFTWDDCCLPDRGELERGEK